MNKIEEISYWIENHSSEIIGNLEQESIDVYNFLKTEFENSDILKNHLFQFVFRSFYRIDNAGLTPEFKCEYFKILEENRNEKKFDFNKILKRLYYLPNRKGQNTFQFSFFTKLINTIDDTFPIYDSEVARMFNLSRPYQSDFDKKLNKYKEQFEVITKGYAQILNSGLIPKTNLLFDLNFENHGLTEVKKLDFIFWSAGKIKNAKGNKI
ncbi:hypothetical protein D1816_02605 [Aquimarina sp. AD10]|uniref:hypothetical protein n=1 Tax=Aquimarina sp. AD10 TaxID=1714849 RepID=UPI000E4E09BB|nr:hypothetical protein [Aquimarina sp. AD10]AXT59283.1 hypothetical protein D1816_02605 [Aquimarina sp. AD10]RKM92430.1 hypothetical protein D7033_20915 [Aquimarina sp. AD10]